MEEAQYLCDDIALLDGGRVLDQGSVAELLERHAPGATLEQVYLRVAGGRLLRMHSARMEAVHVDA